ncbi:MAG TPA: IS66 family insertion sequence element accessory protein TnpB [Chlamydiales bacterium]|nr:IS66 family insertion sequence element accessory protein TnpB [Chlamydiales bacterium]
MLALPAHIFLCKDPVSMRKSFEGLGSLVEQLFPGELLSGSLFVFLNRNRNCMKALFWDRDGFAIYYKRLEKGSFALNTKNNILDRREFFMLLEGIIPQKIRPKLSLKND